MSNVDANFFRPRGDDAKLIAEMRVAFANDAEANAMLDVLERRPLVRWFVLRAIRQEIVAAGLVKANGQIDWEAIGDFLVKIAPIIFEILKMFL